MALFKRSPTNNIPSEGIAQSVENIIAVCANQRRGFERRWYDNNFFDDGFHFRYLSQQTGRIVDQSESSQRSAPTRAIPKASRQIRGVANLLLALDPVPVIYPEKIAIANYIEGTDPKTGKPIYSEEYRQAMLDSKNIAQRIGHWVEEEWKNLRIREQLLAHMVLLTAKHGVSYLKIWPDPVDEKIKASVRDAFDVYLMGNLYSIYESPAITESVPTFISQIKANELFDEIQRAKINPDNKYASSEVKDSYMKSRFGNQYGSDQEPTLLLKESFIKEYLNKDNYDRMKKSAGKVGLLEGKKTGDMMMRHTFTTSNGWLLDEYVDLPEYPYADLRFEPGPIYQVPLIERFIPANKSLDVAMSRIEEYLNTMVVGIWQKRKGENMTISNIPGGQVINYEATPPTQAQPSTVPAYVFQFLNLLDQVIAEQGASTAALGQLPEGVKSGTAIESMKATEYANLKMPTDQIKDTVKRITERMLDVASRYFIEPKTVYRLEKGEPDYFDIIGIAGIKARRKAGLEAPQNTIVLKDDYHVNIEIESGLGYTIAGKKQSMQQIVEYFIKLAQEGLVSTEAVKVITTKFLEVFQFGSTQEFLDAMDAGLNTTPLNEEQIDQMKLAMAEVVKDTGLAGSERDEQDILKTKVGITEAVNDLGGAQ